MKTSIDHSQEAFVKVSLIVVIRKITQQGTLTNLYAGKQKNKKGQSSGRSPKILPSFLTVSIIEVNNLFGDICNPV